jgi:hypothetical protein
MVLLVLGEGPLRQAISDELATEGIHYKSASADSEDLFSEAMGQRAILYAPAASLLDGRQNPQASADRAMGVLHAAEAPSVEVVVAVVPEGEAYGVEVQALARYGKPYVVLQAPILIEEVAEALSAERKRSVWLPNLGKLSVARAQAVAAAAVQATRTEQQGRVVAVSGEVVDAATLIRRAAAQAGLTPTVHGLAAWLYRIVRPLLRWLWWRHSAAYDLVARLFPELGEQPPRALLPAPE